MVKLKYILRYFALNYPYKDELSKTRLTKMVYLSDWISAKKNSKQITTINWFFDHYGPYVTDVYDEARKDKKLEIVRDFNAFGTPKETIYLKEGINELNLNKISFSDKEILDEVINSTKYLNWSEFIDYVYNTYPIQRKVKYNALNLVDLARETRDKVNID